MSFRVDEFRKIEGHIQDRSIEKMPVSELKTLKVLLIKNTPPAEINPIMQLNWDRAYKEITSQIDSKVARRRFMITVCISTIILLVGLLNLISRFGNVLFATL